MILNLQFLRAFAALNVVLFHIIGTAPSYGYSTDIMKIFQDWGANGVDLFFVISGFIMLYIQFERKLTITAFIKSRIIRIVPIYWFLTILVIIMNLIFPSLFRSIHLSPEWTFASLGFVSSFVLEKNPIVHVGWTLEWEMLFYLVFGLSLGFRRWMYSVSVTVATLLLLGVLISNFILVEFIAGMFIALVIKKFGIGTGVYGRTSLLAGFFLLLLSINIEIRNIIESRVIIWGVPSALIVYGAISTAQVKSELGKLLGDASYSIYLIQFFSIPLFYKLLIYFDIRLNSDFLSLLCLFTTVIGGTLLYFVVEKPLIQFFRCKMIT